MGLVASFLESTTRSSQRPRSTIASLSAAIGALYEAADFHPTRDPLLGRVKKAIIRSRTTRPVEHGSTFDTSKLRDLFVSWGDEPSLKQTRTKLLEL